MQLPPGWNAGSLQGYPAVCRSYPLIHLGGKNNAEQSLLSKKIDEGTTCTVRLTEPSVLLWDGALIFFWGGGGGWGIYSAGIFFHD